MGGRDLDEMEQQADYYHLRTGIEALRDEWRAAGLSSKEHRMSRFTYTECAAALDAWRAGGEG